MDVRDKVMFRMPIVAGMFYEASPTACRRAARALLEEARLPDGVPDSCLGGLVPHAGWVCSGSVAALTFKALLRDTDDSPTLLLLGSVHSYSGPQGMLYASGAWRSPLGEVQIDTELADALLRNCPEVHEDPAAHATEHSLEVQVPFIQILSQHSRIVPLMVPPSPLATMIGEQVGGVLKDFGRRVLVVGSTDLTHYGPRYGMTPAGVGRQGIAWATDNDKRLLELVESMSAEQIVDETSQHLNACGGGAVAATIAACRALGAEHGYVLNHTNSYEMLKPYYPSDRSDAVGYASVVFA